MAKLSFCKSYSKSHFFGDHQEFKEPLSWWLVSPRIGELAKYKQSPCLRRRPTASGSISKTPKCVLWVPTWVWLKIKQLGGSQVLSLCFHFPRSHFGYIFLSHCHLAVARTNVPKWRLGKRLKPAVCPSSSIWRHPFLRVLNGPLGSISHSVVGRGRSVTLELTCARKGR